MLPSQIDRQLIQLQRNDNIACLTRTVEKGETLTVGGRKFTLDMTLGLGHKIALRNISKGEKIVKFGVPIGSAVERILVGEHVHLHNMKSDYIPTYTLEDGHKYGS